MPGDRGRPVVAVDQCAGDVGRVIRDAWRPGPHPLLDNGPEFTAVLNGITPCVSPMMFSRHPRAMLSNGGSPTSVPSASALGCFAQATSTTSGAGPVSSRCFATKGRVGWLSSASNGAMGDRPSTMGPSRAPPSAHARVEQTSVLGCRRTRIARRRLTALRPCLSGTPQHPG